MKRFMSILAALALVFTSAAMAESDAVNYSLTTGLPTEKTEHKTVAVQFDNNSHARPQINMIDADVIYEAEVANGGYTRYTAIFNDTIPETVEATRSARIMHIDMALDWDATFVHFGGQQMAGSSVYDYVKGITLCGRFDGLTDGVNFYRDTSRAAPYNVVTRLSQVYGKIERESTRRSPLTFHETDFTVQGDNVNVFRVNYNVNEGYYPSYQYKADEGVYYRYYNRTEQFDGGNSKQYTCANVIVMRADYTWYNNEADRPIVALTGTNKCDYFIGGKHFSGYWVRDDVYNSTSYYDDAGNIVVFKPGKTFIQVVKNDTQLEVVS